MKTKSVIHLNDENVFHNPIIETGADPWMIQHDEQYYYCGSDNASSIFVSSASDPTRIGEAEKVLVWKAPPGRAYSHQTWAPELYCLDGRWYIYFAASNGRNSSHRLYVLEADTPFGPYRFKGLISPPTDRWAIDGTVIEHDDGQRYFVWSGWDGINNVQQNLYIAKMLNPWTLATSNSVLKSRKKRKDKGKTRTPGDSVAPGSLMDFEVTAPVDGDYILEISYRSASAAMQQLEVNGAGHVSLHYVATGPRNTQTHFETVRLKKGANVLSFATGIGDVNLRGIKVKEPFADRRLLTVPEHAWEKLGGPAYVVEGPSAIRCNGKLHIIYSASASWTDDYQLGRLTFLGGDIMDLKNWKKHGPVFQKTESIFGPGHASFIQFRGQDWIVYHTAKYSGAGWNREVRMQPYQWTESNDPDFGRPLGGFLSKGSDQEREYSADRMDKVGA